MWILAALVPVCALMLGGCAIHPLPENVTRETTYDIVQKIRCEGREALDNISLRLLRRSGDPTTLAWANRVEAGEITIPELFERYKSSLVLDPYAKEMLYTYTTSAVTFDFWFDIKEQNHNKATASFTFPAVPGLFSFGANANTDLDREASRKFQIVNNFFELHLLPREHCHKISAKVGNIVYPITGKIGLEEVFETFVKLDSRIEGGVPGDEHRFSDELTFTTTVAADVTPGIVLDPVPLRSFRLASASATSSIFRQDFHRVTLALARGPRVESINQARATARRVSREIADLRRTEDLFIVQRPRGLVILQ